MAWVRIDDAFATSPKVVEVGPLGMAMQVAALCYSNRELTDGHIPRPIARTLVDFEVTRNGKPWTLAAVNGTGGENLTADWVIGLLVDAGLWHEPGHDCETCPTVDRGYLIHDYLEYQASKSAVIARREANAERKSRSRRKSQDTSHAESQRDTEESPPPVTPPPIPIPSDTSPNGDATSLFAALYQFWLGKPYEPGEAKRLTKGERGRLNAAEKDARSAGITPAEVLERGARYVKAWPAIERSPQSLLNHWSRFDGSYDVAPAPAPFDKATCTHPEDRWSPLPEGDLVCGLCGVDIEEGKP